MNQLQEHGDFLLNFIPALELLCGAQADYIETDRIRSWSLPVPGSTLRMTVTLADEADHVD